MKTHHMALAATLAAAAGCGDNARDFAALRAAIADSQVTIGDMAAVAESSMADGRAITAELVIDTAPLYAYDTVGAGALLDVRIDTHEGRIVSSLAAGAGTDGCPGSISIAEAI